MLRRWQTSSEIEGMIIRQQPHITGWNALRCKECLLQHCTCNYGVKYKFLFTMINPNLHFFLFWMLNSLNQWHVLISVAIFLNRRRTYLVSELYKELFQLWLFYYEYGLSKCHSKVHTTAIERFDKNKFRRQQYLCSILNCGK